MSRSQSTLTVIVKASNVQPIISSGMVGLENYLAQMIIKTRHCVLCKNHVATPKVRFTVHSYNLCIGLNETYSCLALNFVVGPAHTCQLSPINRESHDFQTTFRSPDRISKISQLSRFLDHLPISISIA